MKEWRVTVPGSGAWASGTWDFPFDTEAEARAFAATKGGEVYLRDWGELPRSLRRTVAEVKDKRQYVLF
jgi:nitrous oxide reductase accessory protein NosL